MGKINMPRVVIGGLIAGVVLNVIDFVMFGMALQSQMAAAMQALGKPPMTNAQVPWFVFLDFVAGIALVWLYAAIRPRFGPGPKTAILGGVLIYIAITLVLFGFTNMGLMTMGMFVTGSIGAIVSTLAASLVGASIYKE